MTGEDVNVVNLHENETATNSKVSKQRGERRSKLFVESRFPPSLYISQVSLRGEQIESICVTYGLQGLVWLQLDIFYLKNNNLSSPYKF
jgi:hypothetical protein